VFRDVYHLVFRDVYHSHIWQIPFPPSYFRIKMCYLIWSI